MIANKSMILVNSARNVGMKILVGKANVNIILTNVQYGPYLTTHLISVGQLISSNNMIDFDEKDYRIYDIWLEKQF